MGIPLGIGDHIDIGVDATVLRIRVPNFKYPCGPAGFINQVMAIRIITPERSAVTGAQCFFASVGDQAQLTVQHPDKLIFAVMPVTLTGPSPRLDDRQIDAELGQSCVTRQPLARLCSAGLIEWAWITAAVLRRHKREIKFFHGGGHPVSGQEFKKAYPSGLATGESDRIRTAMVMAPITHVQN